MSGRPSLTRSGNSRRALLKERGHALGRVGGLPAVEHAPRIGAVGEHRVLGAEHRPQHAPCQRDRYRGGVLGDLASQLAGRLEQLARRVQAAQQAALESLLRGEHPAGGDPLHRRLMPTTRGRNQLEAASGTMPRRANTKPMRASSAARRMSIGSVIVAPTPTAGPLIAAITGLVEREHAQRELAAVVARDRLGESAGAVVEGLAAAGEVGPGAEAAAGAGDDDRADVVVGVGLIERLDELAAHGRPSRR